MPTSSSLPSIPSAIPIDFQATTLNTYRWGSSEKPPLLLLHGGLAHSIWYQALAPLLATHYYVVACDLPGYGHSTWLDAYTMKAFDQALQAMLRCFSAPPILISHSFSAKLTTYLYTKHADRIRGAILLDPPLLPFTHLQHERRRAVKYYTDRDTLMQRFRIIPPQPEVGDQQLLQSVAKHSITHTQNGYRWCFDPNFWFKLQLKHENPPHILPEQRYALIAGEHSMVSTQSVILDYAKRIPGLPIMQQKNAYHALMLDNPKQLHTLILQGIQVMNLHE